jgi:two-component system phosphate regulon sensor histidine kinase PhoR
MNSLKYKGILYFIAIVILATLCIQVYWNYRNYLIGKQQLINDVQTSLDNAVDGYYTNLAKNNSFNLWTDSLSFRSKHFYRKESIIVDSAGSKQGFDIQLNSTPDKWSVFRSLRPDSTELSITIIDSISRGDKRPLRMLLDSMSNPIESLSSKILVSFREDNLSLGKIDSLLAMELNRKNINIDYGLSYEGLMGLTEKLRPESIERSRLSTTSRSPYSIYENIITVHFSNITFTILKKNMMGILLSFLLVSGVIICLLYLLKVIKQQKQLAEVKNDLINNITHEFKTPIATIGVAMEAIQGFNASGDLEKNLRYAKISQEQVEKLNGMVEKLLETATLDSERLSLNFEVHDLVSLLLKATQKDALEGGSKTIDFHSSEESLPYAIDLFHFENAINNIIDNAIKYGGDSIVVQLKKEDGQIAIDISDNGHSLSEVHKKQIFEKFYRVPKGDTHDVKGFGIGLYYAKKIIEKHGGSITLHLDALTTFKITVPNVA